MSSVVMSVEQVPANMQLKQLAYLDLAEAIVYVHNVLFYLAVKLTFLSPTSLTHSR
jgi:hypothetical protein